MMNYCLAQVLSTLRSISFIAPFVLLLCVVALLNLPMETREQQPQTGNAVLAKAMSADTAATRSTDVFLQLAETVGQSIPAKRLVEYKLR